MNVITNIDSIFLKWLNSFFLYRFKLPYDSGTQPQIFVS